MRKVLSLGQAAGGARPRAAFLTLLVAVNAVAIPFAAYQVTALLSTHSSRPWVAPRPATASETLREGESVTDFTLPAVQGGQTVRLADLRRERPVVLILTSFSCDFFTYHQGFLKDLYSDYRDRAEFLMVVIREAGHPVPGLQFLLTEPVDGEHRRCLVSQAIDVREWNIPAVLDTEDASVERELKAFPLRLVVVSPGGQIDFATRFTPGVFGLDRHSVKKWFEENLGDAIHSKERRSG